MTVELYECVYEKLYNKSKLLAINRREAERFLGKHYHFPNHVSKSILNELKKMDWVSLINRDTILFKRHLKKKTEFKW